MRITYRYKFLLFINLFLVLTILSPVSAEPQHVGLKEAIKIALEESLSLNASELEVQDSRLALSQTEAENLIKPNPASLLQAKRNLEIAQRKFALERYNTVLSVEEAFYNVLKARDYVGLTEKVLELTEHQLKSARSKFAAGMGTQSEIMDCVSRVAEARASIVKAKGTYELTLLNFRQTIGVSLDSLILPEDETFEYEEYLPDLERDIKLALANRVEILQLEAFVDAACTQVAISKNDYTPELVLQRSLIAAEKAKNGLKQLKYGIELEVRQAYLALDDLSHSLEAEMENLATAEENLRIARKLLEADMATTDQVMAAEVGVEQVRINLRHTLYDYNLAKLKYNRAVTRLLFDEEA